MSRWGTNIVTTWYFEWIIVFATKDTRVLQNRVGRFYLGVHRFTAVCATQLELDWLSVRYKRWIDMVRYHNRLIDMKEHRLPVIVYKWERSLKLESWASEIKHILAYSDMLHTDPETWRKFDLDVLESRLRYLNRQKLWQEAHTMDKLVTFVKVHDIDNTKQVAKLNLPRRNRSMIIKLKCGVLPIAVEIGRFKNIKRELRVCRVCNGGMVEDEVHLMYECEALKEERDAFKEEAKSIVNLENLHGIEFLHRILQADMLKITAKYLILLMERRREIMYRVETEEQDAQTRTG